MHGLPSFVGRAGAQASDHNKKKKKKKKEKKKYISRALNPSVSNLPEAQSAVRVQLKLSKQRNQRRQEKRTTTTKINNEKPGMGG